MTGRTGRARSWASFLAPALLALVLAASCCAWPGRALAADGRIMGEVNVKAPGDAAWSRATDAFPSQWADYKVRIYLPSGVQRYGAVDVRAEVFSSGIAEIDMSSIRAEVAGTDVAPAAVEPADGGAAGFTVELADVYSAVGSYDGCEAAVGFRARGSGARDSAGRICSTCSATLFYTAGGDGARGNATVTGGRCYSYTLALAAVDASTGEGLSGAAYTVRVRSHAGDPSLVGKYVGGDGALHDEPVEIADAGSGKALVEGVDGGTYTVEQVAAPEGHATAPAFDLVVSPEINAAKGLISALEAEAFGGASVESTSTAAGTVEVAVPSDAGLALPVTGASGRAAAGACAAMLCALGCVLVLAFSFPFSPSSPVPGSGAGVRRRGGERGGSGVLGR